MRIRSAGEGDVDCEARCGCKQESNQTAVEGRGQAAANPERQIDQLAHSSRPRQLRGLSLRRHHARTDLKPCLARRPSVVSLARQVSGPLRANVMHSSQ